MLLLYNYVLLKRYECCGISISVYRLWSQAQGLDKERRENPEMDLHFQSTEIKRLMDPRMAFFGGWTNATKLLHEFKDGERKDTTSMCAPWGWCGCLSKSHSLK